MPALQNPRHERYAQLIFISLCNGDPKTYSASRAYIAAGYTARDLDRNHRSAQASSSRLLSRVIHRVRELQAQAAERSQENADKIVRELNELRVEAKAKEAYSAAVSAVMGKAKVLGIIDKPQTNTIDFVTANSMHEIGCKLLQSVGFAAPDDASMQAAIEANDVFVAELERIRDAAQGLTIGQDD
jgi:ABC-type transporter Mla subunit MlaD